MNERWIPLSERMPEPDTEVLASYSNGEVSTIFQWWSEGQKPVYADWGEGKPDGARMKVLAWMPLPQAYRVQEGAN